MVTGNAGDIVPVRVCAHLLALPRDLGNLSDARQSSSSIFLGTKAPKAVDCLTSGEDQGGPVLLLQ